MGETMKKSYVIFLALFAFAFKAGAEFVSVTDAARAAQNWIAPQSALKTRMMRAAPQPGPEVASLSTTNGTAFYSVSFGEKGTVFMSSDTDIEPIIAFVKNGASALEKGSPLWTLLNRDLSRRASAVKASSAGARARWARLLRGGVYLATASENQMEFLPETDVRVAPFVKTKWNQSEAYTQRSAEGATFCYDYYVPRPLVTYENADGTVIKSEPEAVPCGCVATAMAQVMRFWTYPMGEVPKFNNNCERPIDGVRIVYSPDGSTIAEVHSSVEAVALEAGGAAYDWANMPEFPLQYWGGLWYGKEVDETQCEAIGRLTYDCGVAVKMSYDLSIKGGSGAYGRDIDDAMKEKFGFQSAAYFGGSYALSSDAKTRANVILSNLDAECPVILCITGDGGHAVVADGYGISGPEETAYVHLNMGWGGQNDVWYNLPLIDTGDNPEEFEGFDTIQEVVYNIFPTNAGEVVSGRVTGLDGNAVSGAVVSVSADGVEIARTLTSRFGIYSFIVQPGQAYQLKAIVESEDLVDECTTEVIKNDSAMIVGNRWGNDMVLKPASVRHDGEIYARIDTALAAARLESTNDVAKVQRIEILRDTELLSDFRVDFRCAISSTNADAFASQVIRPSGARLIVTAEGALIDSAVAALSLSNVVFSVAGTPTVDVCGDGVLDVAGTLGIEHIKTTDASVLRLSAPISVRDAIYVSAANMAPNAAAAMYDGSADAMASSAKKLVNFADDRLYGHAKDGGTIVWQYQPCDPAIAKVKVESGAEIQHYIRLDYAIEYLNGAAAGSGASALTLLRPDCALTKAHTLKGDLTLSSSEGSTVSVGNGARFTVGAGATLEVSNVKFTGYSGSDGSSFITVDGENAAVVLGAGSEISNCRGTYGGAVCVLNGSATLKSGAKISGCTANYGGAFYIEDAASALKMEGGTVFRCYADVNGGAVYAWRSKVDVSGDLSLSGNESGNYAVDNLFLSGKECNFVLSGRLTGGRKSKVGVRYSDAAKNKLGAAFVEVAPSLGDADVADSCAHFANDADSSLAAEAASDGAALVWALAPEDDGQVDPEDASVLVVYNAGTLTNYYDSAAVAFENLTGENAEVVLLEEVEFAEDLTVSGAVTLRSHGDSALQLVRTGDCTVYVPAGASLTVTNLTLKPLAGDDSQFKVDGGALTLAAGAEIFGNDGSAARDSAAVTVWNRGVFTMTSGSAIRYCGNGFYSANAAATGIGGAVLIDNAFGYFTGGVIEGCWADRAGGVAACNSAKIYVSGDLCVINNTKLDRGVFDNVVIQDSSSLYLAGELTGPAAIGVTKGVSADASFIGYVENWRSWSVDSLTNSAVRFINDVTADYGVAVTNAQSSTALIVWRESLSNPSNGVYTAADGRVFGQLGDGSEVPVLPPQDPEDPDPENPDEPDEPVDPDQPDTPDVPVVPEEPVYAQPRPVAFTSITKIGDGAWVFTLTNGVEYCVYTLYGAPALPPVWSAERRVTLAAGDIADDGTFSFTLGAATTNRFWRVTAEPGVIVE